MLRNVQAAANALRNVLLRSFEKDKQKVEDFRNEKSEKQRVSILSCDGGSDTCPDLRF